MMLEGFPQTLALRDGSHLTVRPAARGDEAALLAFYRALPEEDRQFLKDDVTTDSWAERFIQRIERGEATALAGRLVKIATDQGAEKLLVEVLENQAAALRTFETLGFSREAVLRGHVKDISGIRRDLHILSNDVSHIWEAMEALLADAPPEAE